MNVQDIQSGLLGLALRLLTWLGDVGLGLFGWAEDRLETVWDWGVRLWAPANMVPVLTGATGHSIVQAILVVGMAGLAINFLKSSQRKQRERRERKKDKESPLSDRRPFRVPYFDRFTRPLRVSRKVTVDLKDEHGASIGMTGSGKSSVMSNFVTGQEANFGLLFDVSLPTIAAIRRLQRKIIAGKLFKRGTERALHWWCPWIKTGEAIYPPVYVWRPRDATVVLRLLEGIPEDVMDSIRDAFSRSSGDTGHQWGIVFKLGVLILNALDKKKIPRTLTALSKSLEAVATGNEEYLEELFGEDQIPDGALPADVQTRNACWNWATKLSSLKAMFGEAEGPTGFVPAEILDKGGTLACEFNTFASKATAEAISGFALRILSSALNYCHVPVMVMMDESGQMKGRATDIASIFRAARARGGRCWLCTQDPTDLLSAMATNIGIWVVFGVGAGAIDVLKWCASITHGRREPGDYIMTRRTLGLVIQGKLGLRKIRIHRECDVIYEGSIVFTTVDAPNARTLKRDLHHRDWPNNRGIINDHGLTAEIPAPPLPVAPERPKQGAATAKPATWPLGPQPASKSKATSKVQDSPAPTQPDESSPENEYEDATELVDEEPVGMNGVDSEISDPDDAGSTLDAEDAVSGHFLDESASGSILSAVAGGEPVKVMVDLLGVIPPEVAMLSPDGRRVWGHGKSEVCRTLENVSVSKIPVDKLKLPHRFWTKATNLSAEKAEVEKRTGYPKGSMKRLSGPTKGGKPETQTVYRWWYELITGKAIPKAAVNGIRSEFDHLCHTYDDACPGSGHLCEIDGCDDPAHPVGKPCMHTLCYQLEHLELVTPEENKKRSGQQRDRHANWVHAQMDKAA